MPQKRPTAREVFDDHGRYVWRVLRYFGVRDADVADVAQEVFITVHRKIDEFEGRSSLRTWLYRICQHAASDYRRRAAVRYEIATESPAAELDARERSDPVSALEARAALNEALGRMDDAKRSVFVLYEIEGLTMREVCEILACPLQTAYSRLHAARKIVETILAPEKERT